jgi:hypothetical protein
MSRPVRSFWLRRVRLLYSNDRRPLAPSASLWAHRAFPELKADRPYHRPGDDSRPFTPADSSLWPGNRSAPIYRTSPPVWRSTGRSIGSQGSQTIGQISGARCHDVGKDRDATPVAGVHVGVVLHQQIDHHGSVRQCAVQTVQRRPAVLIACVRQAWIVRQQRAKPVGSIAADRVMDPGAIDQQVDAVALPEVAGPANRRAVVHLVAEWPDRPRGRAESGSLSRSASG